jgi:hypothetical protein
MYYAADGYVLENVHTIFGWSLPHNKTIVNPEGTVKASASGPIAAATYYLNDTYVRQVFFTNDAGIIYTVTSKTFSLANTITWNSPTQIHSETLASAPGSGLTVCVDTSTTGMNGMRLYYGSGSGVLQELQWSFARPASGWTIGQNWTEADHTSGVDCVFNNANSTLNVFWRNDNSGSIQQAVQSFVPVASDRSIGE